MLRRILCPQISQHMFRCIHVLAGIFQQKLSYILCPHCHGRGLVNSWWNLICVSYLAWEGFWDESSVVAGLGGVRSTHVEMHFLLAWLVFFQHNLYAFCVLASMGWVWSTHVLLHFECSLAFNACWDSYCFLAGMEGVIRRILCPR